MRRLGVMAVTSVMLVGVLVVVPAVGPGRVVDAVGVPVTAISVNTNHSCALLISGQVTCWGYESGGELGNGATSGVVTAPPASVVLPGYATATAIANGFGHTCALLIGGQISCWGGDNFGQLGNGAPTGSVHSPPAPITLPGGATATAISAGADHMCALLNSGQVTCWGSDGSGQLGNGAPTANVTAPPAPVALPGGATATAVSAGGTHTCALLDSGQVTCWGADQYQQLGNGTGAANVTAPPAPVTLPGGATATAVSASFTHTCALLDTGQVTCWGSNVDGQLGNGTTSTVNAPPAPITLPGGATATAITSGRHHTCALLTTGQVTCWGGDTDGQLGNGSTTGKVTTPPAPVVLPGGVTATAISAGSRYTCALLSTGWISCWGANPSAQLGDGTTVGKVSPVLAAGGPRMVTVLAEDTTGTSTVVGEQVEDPVNTASGNLSEVHTDLSGEAFGLDLVRAYNGFDQSTSALGARWRFSTGPAIGAVGADYRLSLADGSRFLFVADGFGGWVTPDGLQAELSVDPAAATGGGGLPMLRVAYRDGNVDRFDTLGRLVEQLSWDGRSAVSTYDAGGRLSTVTASTGQVLTFAYDTGNRLVSAALSNGRTVTYGYNGAGRFATFTDEFGAVTSMTYTPEGWLQSVTAPGGVLKMSNTYDSDGRVITQTSASGGVTTFAYNLVEGSTSVHDSVTDTSVRYYHDPEGRVTGIVDAYAQMAARGYDAASNVTAIMDRNGIVASASYDANGNMLSTTQPGVGTTTYTYDTNDRLTSVDAPGRGVTSFGYDGAERIPSTVTNGLGEATTSDVVDGLVMSVTDADGVVTTYEYTPQRRLESVSNAYDETTTYSYNTRGQLTTTTSPGGKVTVAEYDPVTYRLVSMTAPDLGVTEYTYDAAGRIETITDPTDAVTTHTYDTAGRLATVTDAGGAVTTYQYDANDRLVKTIQPGGAELETTYGPLGRITSTEDALDRATTYDYDAEGRQTTATDPAGGVRQTLFDESGRAFKTIDPENRETVIAYDAFGRVATVTAPGSLVTTYGYDALGRVQTTTDPRGGVTTTAYTPGGRTETITDPVGLVTSFGYDQAGRHTSTTAPGSLTTTYTYNPDSQVVTTTTPGGLVTATTYDPVGRLATLTDPAGVVTTNTWSLRGELLTTKTGQEGTVSHIYNPNGTLASSTDPLGRQTTFGYDARNNLTTRTAPDGAVNTWTYDAANQLLTSVDPLGRTTTNTYDTTGRLATVTDPSGRIRTNTYNPDGTLNTVAYAGGSTTTYGYDPAGRVATLADSSGTATFGYEPGGQLASMTSPAGRHTTWTYDTAGRRTALGYPDGATYQYAYDTAGRPWKITAGETMADTFTAATGTAPDNGRWTKATAANGTATIQTNMLRLLWANTASSTASITAKSAAAQDSEQVVRYQFAATSGSKVGKFIVKARNSTAGNIRVEFTSNSTTATIYKQVGTTSTSLGTFSTTVGTTPKWVRLRVIGTTVDVRAWADGTTEPTTWNKTVTTATGVTTAGTPKLEVTRTSGTNSVTIDSYRHTDPTTAASPIVAYAYNTDSQVTDETLIGGTRSRSYTLGRLTNFTSTLPGLNLITGRTYDTTGRIATETTGTTTTTYGYDAASQLTNATPSTGTASAWTYDQNGNRATETIGATTTSYQRDLAGQLCWTTTSTMPPTPTCAAPPSGATTYTHDNAGRLLTETVTATNKATHTYDPAGRLATTQRITGATTTTQTRTYDPLNQLTATTNTGASTTNAAYDWDPTNPATQLLAITTANVSTDLVGGSTGWAAARTATNTAIGQDIYNNVVPTTGTTNLARSDTYTPHGTPTTGTNTLDPRLAYRGELTFDNQLYLRARTYQPTLGQFTTTDPVPGTAGTSTLNNNYTYANNDPLHLVDPLGLYGITDDSLSTRIPHAESAFAPSAIAAAGAAAIAAAEVGGGAALATVAVPIAVFAGAVGGATFGLGPVCYLWCKDYRASKDAQRDANKALAYTHGVVQEGVNNGDIPPGTYGGKNYEPEPGSPAAQTVYNRAGRSYPDVIDPRTGISVARPPTDLTRVPVAERVRWGSQERGAFIKQWYDEGFETPPGGWAAYDIHHIVPREYGGTNAFDNLVPVQRDIHQQELNAWWRDY